MSTFNRTRRNEIFIAQGRIIKLNCLLIVPEGIEIHMSHPS